MWVEKYRPRAISEMVGNEETRMAAAVWLQKWKPGSKALLLIGPPGTGKTTFVYLLAKEKGMNIISLNASDVRTKSGLERRIGEATKTVSLLGERSIIFLDEVDGLLGRSDYGGVEFIKEAVKETENPIIMAANNPDADEIKKLASSSLAVRFRPPPPREVELYLRRILSEEKVEIDSPSIVECVKTAGGDIRQAINALQSHGGYSSRSSKDLSLTVSSGLAAFFEAESASGALDALRRTPLQPVEKVREIERSVIKAGLSSETLGRALEVLSRADVLMGKIRRTQQWRLLRYLDNMLAQELHPILTGTGVRYAGADDLPFPTLLRIWNDSKKVTEVSRRYAALSHTGPASARSQDLPYVFSMCSRKEFREQLERSLNLDETFDKFLSKEGGR